MEKRNISQRLITVRSMLMIERKVVVFVVVFIVVVFSVADMLVNKVNERNLSMLLVVMVKVLQDCRNANHKLQDILRHCQPNSQQNNDDMFCEFHGANVIKLFTLQLMLGYSL